MRRIVIVNVLLAALTTAAYSDTRQLGTVHSAKTLIGKSIYDTRSKIGEARDFAVDLESGRILFAVVEAEGTLVGVPTTVFNTSGTDRLMIRTDSQKIGSAPKFENNNTQLSDAAFARRVYEHFGQSLGWEGRFNNAHKASELMGMNVQNVSNQKIGDVENLGLDLKASRVTYVILGSGAVSGAGDDQYVLPPNSFTLGADNKSLVCDLDKERLSGAPQFRNGNWQRLSEPEFAARVYNHYGKQPYWTAQLTPTGRDEGNPRDRISRDRDDDGVGQRRDADDRREDGLRTRRAEADDRREDGLRNRRDNIGTSARMAAGQFANVEEVQRLIGMNVQTARGAQAGKLQDIAIDLESGRVIYALVDQRGRGTVKAVAPSALSLSSDDKTLRLLGDETRLQNAPDFNQNRDLANTRFAERVYRHFDQPANWFDRSDTFGNAHLASEVLKMRVQNVSEERVGQVQNMMVDLQKGRVLYVIMSAAQVVGRGEHLFAIPPNAFTLASDKRYLVTDVDKAKLEAAPRFSRANLRELANPVKAAEIYRYYGKQPYWSGERELSPTGRERGRSNSDRNSDRKDRDRD